MKLTLSQLTIDPRFQARLFPLRTEEYEALRESIEREGVRDALVVWRQGDYYVVVDGHHRLQIARELGLEVVPAQECAFESEDDALRWIDENQLARRNLTDEQRALLIGRLYEAQKRGTGRPKKLSQIETISVGATKNQVAKQANVAPYTVIRSNKFARAVEALAEVSPRAAERVLAGEIQDALTRLPQLLDNQELLQAVAQALEGDVSKVATAIAHARRVHQEALLAPYQSDIRGRKSPVLLGSHESLEIRRGDFRVVLADVPNASVDVILTDPPYGKDALPLWEDLASFAARVLKPSGVLIAYSGQMYLPEVIRALTRHLEWWWLMGVAHAGQSNLTFVGRPARKVINRFKPIVMCIPPNGLGVQHTFHDLIEGAGAEKDLHNWGQPQAEAEAILRMLKLPEDALVVDPFAGSGAFGAAAIALNYRFLGAELLEVPHASE